MLSLETTLHPVVRQTFIRNGDTYLLYSDQAPSLMRLDPADRLAIKALVPGAPLIDWVERAGAVLGVGPEAALRVVHRLAHAMQQAGHLEFGAPPEPVDWVSKVVDTAHKGSRTAYLSLTDACNLTCAYCYNEAERACSRAGGAAALSDSELTALIDRLAEAGFDYVVFTGGEPMLRKSIFRLAGHARDRGLGVNLLTNGTAFTARNVGQVTELFDSVTVSLDSALPEEHDALRGAGSWRLIVAGLDRLIAAGAHRVALRPVITARNVQTVHRLPGFAHGRWGITRFEPCLFLPSSPEQTTLLGLLPDVDAYAAATERFALALRAIPGATADDPLKAISYGGRCGMADTILSVSASGDVYPCQALHFDALRMGNVRQDDVEQLFAAARAQGIAGASGLDTPECRDCAFLMLCGGGCRANVFQLYGDLRAHNATMCRYLRNSAEGQLRRYANHLLGTAADAPASVPLGP